MHPRQLRAPPVVAGEAEVPGERARGLSLYKLIDYLRTLSISKLII